MVPFSGIFPSRSNLTQGMHRGKGGDEVLLEFDPDVCSPRTSPLSSGRYKRGLCSWSITLFLMSPRYFVFVSRLLF